MAKRVLALENCSTKGTLSTWDYQSASEIMEERATLAPSYVGINYQRLDNGEQLHWPVMSLTHAGTPMLHIDQFSCGKGKFNVCEHLPADELPTKAFSFVLTTGRVLYHWHGTEMTRRSEGLLFESSSTPQTNTPVSVTNTASKGGVIQTNQSGQNVVNTGSGPLLLKKSQ